MRGTICFFSGGGSSFAIAKDLSRDLDCRPVSIVRGRGKESISDGELLGFVFPVYHATYGGSGVPSIVEEFLFSIGPIHGKYVFVVCAHSGMPALTVGNFKAMVEEKGGSLAAAATVQMKVPYSTARKMRHMLFGTKLTVNEAKEAKRREKLQHRWQRKCAALVAAIDERRTMESKRVSPLRRLLYRALFASQRGLVAKRYKELAGFDGAELTEMFRAADTSFEVSATCTGCGICSRICPVDNITMVDKRPQWHHNCELCLACYSWCPHAAIGGKIVEFEKRATHPEISTADMINRK